MPSNESKLRDTERILLHSVENSVLDARLSTDLKHLQHCAHVGLNRTRMPWIYRVLHKFGKSCAWSQISHRNTIIFN